jgi:hypothetical protein
VARILTRPSGPGQDRERVVRSAIPRARNLIFESDGAVCDLSSAIPADAAGRPRAVVQAELPSALRDDPIA